MLLLLPNDGAPASSSAPLPDFVSAPPPWGAAPAARTTLPPKLDLLDWLTVSIVPAATLTRAVPVPSDVPDRLLTVWLLPRFTAEVIESAALTTSGPIPSVP